MGSGRGKKVTVSIREKPELDAYNQPFMHGYFMSLEQNLEKREEYIRREIDSKKRTRREMMKIIREFKIDSAVLSDVYSTLSVSKGDKVLKIDESKGLTEKQWLAVYKELGGEDYGAEHAYDNYNNYIMNVQFGNRARDVDSPKDVLRRTYAGNPQLNDEVINQAFYNMEQHKSPYFKNEEARGKLTFDTRANTPSVIENRIIDQRIHFAMEKFSELDEAFQSVYPSSSYLRGISFQAPLRSGGMADYNPMNKRIRVGAKLLSPEYDNKNQGYYTVAMSTHMPLLESVTHEFGHAVHFQLLSDMKSNPELKSVFDKYNGMFTFNIRNPKESENLTIEAVSPYGNHSKYEAFAEAFSLYLTGEEPKYHGVEYYSNFKNLMKDLKLDKFHGMYKSLPIAPEANATPNVVNYKINGKDYSHKMTPTSTKRGTFTKKIDNVRYTLDTETGTILNREIVR